MAQQAKNIFTKEKGMKTESTINVHNIGQKRNPSGMTYLPKGTKLRVAIDKSARTNAAIKQMLLDACVVDPNSTLPVTGAQ
jgi:hypothetical protein